MHRAGRGYDREAALPDDVVVTSRDKLRARLIMCAPLREAKLCSLLNISHVCIWGNHIPSQMQSQPIHVLLRIKFVDFLQT